MIGRIDLTKSMVNISMRLKSKCKRTNLTNTIYSKTLSITGTFQALYFVTTSNAFLLHQFLH